MVKQELFKNIPELELDRALDNKQNRLLSRSYEVSAFITGTRKTTQYSHGQTAYKGQKLSA